MLRVNRILHAANHTCITLLCLIIVFFFVGIYSSDGKNSQIQTSVFDETPNKPPSWSSTIWIERSKIAEEYKPDCRDPANHDEADTCIQRESAYIARKPVRWANRQMWIAGLQLLISVFGLAAIVVTLWYTAKVTRETGRAADAARVSAEGAVTANRLTQNMFIADQRPWLKLEIFCRDIEFNSQGDLIIGLNIKIKNFGKSPAMEVILNYGGPTISTTATGSVFFHNIRETICQASLLSKQDNLFLEQTIIFPTAIKTHFKICGLSKQELISKQMQVGREPDFVYFMFYCFYNSIFTDATYETTQMYSFGLENFRYVLPAGPDDITQRKFGFELFREVVT